MAAGNKSVNLTLLGNNIDAREKIEAVELKAEELKKLHPELSIGIDSAAASEKLKIFKDELKQAGDAGTEAGQKIRAGMAEGASGVDVMDKSLGELSKETTAAKLGLEETGVAAKVAGDELATSGEKAKLAGKKTAEGAEAGEKAWGVAKLAILGLGGAIGFGIYKAAGFQQEMEHLHTQANVSVGVMNQLSGGVLKLAGDVGQNPDSLAEAAYHVASNMSSMGATSTQMLMAVKVAAEGASVGSANLVDVTNALGAAIASGMKGTQDYTQAMGALNATVGAGDMQMQDLAEAFGTGVLANVKLYGATLNDVGAALATFGDNNIRGANAATALRMAVQSIAVQAKTAKPVLEQLGLGIDDLGRAQRLHGTVAAINLLVQHLKAAKIPTAEWGQMITELFGKKAGAGIGVLVSQYERLNSKQHELTAGAKGFGAAWKAQQGTAGQQMKDLEFGAEALVTQLGLKLLPAAIDVMKVMNEFLGVLSKNAAAAGILGGVIGVLLAGLAMKKLEDGLKGSVEGLEGMWGGIKKVSNIVGTAVEKLFGLAAAQEAQTAATEGATVAQTELDTAMDANPIGLIIIAIAALVIAFVLLWKHSKAFRDFWKETWHDILSVVDWVFNWVKHNWPLLLGILTGPIGLAVVLIIKYWKDITKGVSEMFHDVVNFFHDLPHKILSVLGNLANLLYSVGKTIISGLIHGLEDAIPGLSSVLNGITNLIPSWKGPPERDAVLLKNSGHLIMHGLVEGLNDGLPELHGQLTRTTNVIGNTRVGGSGVAGSGGGLTAEWIGGNQADAEFITWLKKNIRIRGGNPAVLGR